MAVRLRYRDSSGRSHKSLFDASDNGRSRLDVATISARLVFSPPFPLDSTIYEGVRVEPVRDEPLPPLDDLRVETLEEARRAVRAGVERAVEHAFGDAKVVAVLASGGLDSAGLAVAAHAHAKRTGKRALIAALDFGGHGDDRPYLAALERHLGIEVLRLKPEDCVGYEQYFETGIDAAPWLWPSGGMFLALLAKARSCGAERALSGGGGDQAFDGSPTSLAITARSHPIRAARAARLLQGFRKPRSRLLSWLIRPNLAKLQPRSMRRWRASRSPIHAERWSGAVLRMELERLHVERVRRAVDPELAPSCSPYVAPADELSAWVFDQAERVTQLPVATPYLEPTFLALLRRIHPPWFLTGNVRRGLFRLAFSDALPQSLIGRQDKAGFGEALRRFRAATGGFARLRHLASVDELAALGLVSPDAFQEAFRDFERTDDPTTVQSTVIWPALAFEAFLRHRRRCS